MRDQQDPQAQWELDNRVLAKIGAALFDMDTRLPVELSNELADAAKTAWNRDDPAPDAGTSDTEPTETAGERIVRHRAGSLALIGAAIQDRAQRRTADTISVELDAWFIGHALDAADDHGLIAGPATPRPTIVPRFVTIDVDITAAPGQSLDALVAALLEVGTVRRTRFSRTAGSCRLRAGSTMKRLRPTSTASPR